MPVEQRGQAIAFEIGSTGNGRNPIFNGRRQPSCGGTSRMTRECQVRICERLGVKFPGPTRPSRTWRNVRLESAKRTKADIDRASANLETRRKAQRGPLPADFKLLLQVQLLHRLRVALHVVFHKLHIVRGAVLFHNHAELLHSRGQRGLAHYGRGLRLQAPEDLR
jgi:hypothetical protein